MHWLSNYIEGFIMGAGLIIAIGAQNAFVLKQGIKRQHRAVVAWICALSDGLLITLGIAGMGFIFTNHPAITKTASFAGTFYLVWFACRSFISAFKGESMSIESSAPQGLSIHKAILTTLALTFLNPHVYLDTVVMLGSFGAARPAAMRPFYGLGAVTASFIWFFVLAYSGKFLAPLFRKQISWRILDTAIGIIMLYISVKLALFGLHS